jgi:hypothetical protein
MDSGHVSQWFVSESAMLRLYEGIAGAEVGREHAHHDGEGGNQDGASPAVVTITVMRGRDLLAKDRGGTSDPYVRVHIGDAVARARKTKVKNKTLNPTWMEEFEFAVSSAQRRESIVVEAFDKDTFGSDDTLGRLGIPIETLAPDKGTAPLPVKRERKIVQSHSVVLICLAPRNQSTATGTGSNPIRRKRK